MSEYIKKFKFLFDREKPESSSEEEVTDDGESEDEEKAGSDEGGEDDRVPKQAQTIKREWTSKEEAKQAFKDLLREKVTNSSICLLSIIATYCNSIMKFLDLKFFFTMALSFVTKL